MTGDYISKERERFARAVDDSLGYLREFGIKPEFDVYSDQNIAEILTQHPTPMSFGIFTHIFAHNGAIRIGRNMMGYDIGEELSQGFFELVGWQPRVSIIRDALTYRIKGIPLKDYFQCIVIAYLEAVRRDPQLANYPEISLYNQIPSEEELVSLFGVARGSQYHQAHQCFFDNIRAWEERYATRFLQQWRSNFQDHMEIQCRQELNALDLAQLINLIQNELEYLRIHSCVAFVIAARLGFFAYARLFHRLESLYGDNGDNKEAKAKLEELTAELPDNPTKRFHDKLARVSSGELKIAEFLGEFGHLGVNELEISGPRFWENSRLLTEVSPEALIRRDDRRVRAQKAEELCARIVKLLPPDEAKDFELDLASARRYLALREEVKCYFSKQYDLIRQCLLLLQTRLGFGDQDIFYLYPRELPDLEERRELCREKIRLRRKSRAGLMNVEIPAVLFTDQLDEIGKSATMQSQDTLKGLGASPFIAVGQARIVGKPNENGALGRIKPGNILVAPNTDPGWMPLLSAVGKKGGLVTEVGGMLSHGAIVARDLGIAAVLNVHNATRIIPEGRWLQVNGNTGEIRILPD